MNYLNSVFVVLLVILIAIGAFGYVVNEYLDLRELVAERDAQILTLQGQLTDQAEQHQTALEAQRVELTAQCQAALDAQLAEQTALRQTELGEQLAEQTALCQAELDAQATELTTQFQVTLEVQLAEQSTECQAALDEKDSLLAETEQDMQACLDTQGSAGNQPGQYNPGAQLTPVEAQIPPVVTQVLESIAVLVAGLGGAVVLVALILRVKVHKAPVVPQPNSASTVPHPYPKQVTVQMNTQAYQGYLDYLKAHKK